MKAWRVAAPRWKKTAIHGRLLCAGLALGLRLFAASAALAQPPTDVAVMLQRGLRGTQATAVVLDWTNGTVLAKVGRPRRGLPGSAIKPLLLEYALEHGIVREETEVYCRRSLHLAGRDLPCTHPADQPVFTAERAVAESCNTWFAEMGRRFTGEQMDAALAQWQLPHWPMRAASGEDRQLAALGLRGVLVSPRELARAYRELLRSSPPDGAAMRGLRGSVSYGMARSAAVAGVAILGKTGTAHDPGDAWTHGWFAGALPGKIVLVIYLPGGDGGTAAALAGRFFEAVSAAPANGRKAGGR
jgi:cell division protein FtsI/penicillin-binding protein 2